MLGLFKRAPAPAAPDTAALGVSAVAIPLAAGCIVPALCVGVAFDKGGRTRRIAPGGRVQLDDHELACCFHPGPYSIDLLPFAAAPELGLRVTFAIDAPDPRVMQQRFDLYLVSEAAGGLVVADINAAIETTLQRELAQGNLELPACTTLAEWNRFRAGLNQLLYTRFGLIVDDCIPVDLGEQVDYARILLARAALAPQSPGTPVAALAAAKAPGDAEALRRLFLELPCVMCALRLAVLPPGQELFRQQQALLLRLDQVSLSFATMPALELLAPGQPLAPTMQARRASHTVAAAVALDEAWALLARLSLAAPDQLANLFDEADRIAANLEWHAGRRRLTQPESEEG